MATVGAGLARALATQGKTLLFLADAFPQVPGKPLAVLTAAPAHRDVALASAQGPIIADLFLPTPRFTRARRAPWPAVVVAMGIKTSPENKTLILDVAQALSRLGYAVLWPRLRAIESGSAQPEHPDTFIAGVRYLQGLAGVAPRRISLLGLSVGAALAFVAAADPRINRDVHALVFFGGYFDLGSYLTSLASRTLALDGHVVPWHPAPEAIAHIREILQAEHAVDLGRLFTHQATARGEVEQLLRSAPERERERLRQASPSAHLPTLRAPLFILHDKGDAFVPFAESVMLARALPPRLRRRLLITHLFGHVQPRASLSWPALRDAAALYRFAAATLGYLSAGEEPHRAASSARPDGTN